MKNLKYLSIFAVLFASLTFSCTGEIISPNTHGGDDEEDKPIIIDPDSTNVAPPQTPINVFDV